MNLYLWCHFKTLTFQDIKYSVILLLNSVIYVTFPPLNHSIDVFSYSSFFFFFWSFLFVCVCGTWQISF
uniref:Uncharacterized protein n=1 Tax=Rhinolophus ferrumequinum TaxID=59479 RepID=A0A671FPH0_RHIFE